MSIDKNDAKKLSANGVSVAKNFIIGLLILLLIAGTYKPLNASGLFIVVSGMLYNNPISMAVAQDQVIAYQSNYEETLHSHGVWYRPDSIKIYMRDKWPKIIAKFNQPLPNNCIWTVGHYFMINKATNQLQICVIPTLVDTVQHKVHEIWINQGHDLNVAMYPILKSKGNLDDLAYDEGDMFP